MRLKSIWNAIVSGQPEPAPEPKAMAGVGVPCPECSWDEALEGELVINPVRLPDGSVRGAVAGRGYVCLNCGLPFINSSTHGAYRPNKRARDDAERIKAEREKLAGQIAQAQTPVGRSPRMPKGMEDMRERPKL